MNNCPQHIIRRDTDPFSLPLGMPQEQGLLRHCRIEGLSP